MRFKTFIYYYYSRVSFDGMINYQKARYSHVTLTYRDIPDFDIYIIKKVLYVVFCSLFSLALFMVTSNNEFFCERIGNARDPRDII